MAALMSAIRRRLREVLQRIHSGMLSGWAINMNA